ncbi:DUF2934 domain-containing protein [Rhizobium sp. LjRoot30]|uniref:DUF2934 domain-containing protein n=1 Tax=Rhizobium sp. LjRoot30 TaxID=3342320 RepID=UPI003ECC9B5C
MAETVYERVKKRAYEIWEEEGRPWGRDALHWERANREIADQTETETPVRVASIIEEAPSEVIDADVKAPVKRRAKKVAV